MTILFLSNNIIIGHDAVESLPMSENDSPDVRNRGVITCGEKNEVFCTSECLCVLRRGLPSPETQNHSRVQDTFNIHPRLIEYVFPTMKKEKYTHFTAMLAS